MDVIGPLRTSTSLLVTNQSNKLENISFAKHSHMYSHVLLKEMLEILRGSKKDGVGLRNFYKEVVDACLVCAKSGLPLLSKTVFKSHMCQSFVQ